MKATGIVRKVDELGRVVIPIELRRTLGIALSGNPFAASATFELLARPVLAKLTAQDALLPMRRRAVLRDGFSKASRGRRFVRAQYAQGEVHLPEKHASGVLFYKRRFLDLAQERM